ncbi:hypothetical protein NEOLEDRAFT_524175 [Neolentinus lepideus HHB14362 ss-1]|uniref:C2H2-type domain-containing protein n=1 Tax=Neolentinus lepideus HHB14362 ss-1 TaxID=1314782 RepID=A0A165RCZ8_9AGAM|nr:hypothetical protein NEOLEDRAFT_524175 [Neolentinus lepideus HHB14362 ss-1]
MNAYSSQLAVNHSRSDEHSISSFALGHKPYMSPRLLCSPATPSVPVSKSTPAFPTDSYMHATYPNSHSMDFFVGMQTDTFDNVRSEELQSFAFPESSQRTLLPETPFGMYDSLSSDSLASRFAMQDWPEGGEGETSPHFPRSSFVGPEDHVSSRSYDAGRKQSDMLLSLYENYFSSQNHDQMMGTFATAHQQSPTAAAQASPRPDHLPPVFLTLQLNSESLEALPDDQSAVARIFNFAEDSDDDDDDDDDYFERSGSWMASSVPDDSSYLDADLSSFGSDQNLDRQWTQSPFTLVGSSMGTTGSDQSLKDGSASPVLSMFDPESPISDSTPGRSFSGSSLSGLTSASPGTQKKTTTKKKSKMHQCGVCQKWFPRPSGLKTHMNSHSGEKPYKCTVPNCNKSFAVRSNAKRHLRTHGIIPTSEPSSRPTSRFTVGFETPMISSSAHEMTKIPPKLKWIPQSLQKCTNVAVLQRESSVEDDYSDEAPSPSPSPVLPVPLPAVVPSLSRWSFDDDYEERNSFNAEIGTYPYHPSQVCLLPSVQLCQVLNGVVL